MSVRCGYCGKYGHNARTCPERSEHSKKLSESQYRTQGRKKGSSTMCSYCGLLGHNRRTCPHLKRRKQEALKSIEGSIGRALLEFQAHGVGVGALFEQKLFWRELTGSYMVTGEKFESGVSYQEERFREEEPTSGEVYWSKQQVPTFRVWIGAKKMFGEEEAPVRCEVSKVFVYNDNERQFAGLHHLRPFAREDCNNKWLVKSSTSFPDAVAERLRERAAHEVNEYYRHKENRHPHFAEDDWFEKQELAERHG